MMTIDYLQKYESNKDKFKYLEEDPVIPCTMEEILLLEEEINNGELLPKAFREYLFIGGQYSGLPFEMGYRSMSRLVKRVKQDAAKRGLIIDRPIVVFHHYEGKSFSFIYLDEGDDPQPWNISISEAYDTTDDEMLWKVPFPSFSSSIDLLVDRAILGEGM